MGLKCFWRIFGRIALRRVCVAIRIVYFNFERNSHPRFAVKSFVDGIMPRDLRSEGINVFIEKRTNRTSVTFSVVYYGEDGKRRRLKQSEHPKFPSTEDGEAWCKAQKAIYATRKAAHEKKLSWRNTYYDFNDLLTLFTAYQKKQAPNSWEGNVGYLQNWIFPFFLNLQHMGNVNDWPSKFQEFRDWISSGLMSLRSCP
jgi:hypothetical protein